MTKTNIETNVSTDSYQVIIHNITWNKTQSTRSTYNKKDFNEELPTQFILDIPENILIQANKVHNNFNDIIESFCYTFLTHKFNHEVWHCQIALPL